MHGDFTWVDLSTFDVAAAEKFYGSVLHWEFESDESGYVNCSVSNDACAGLYEMPEFFQKIRMPSFWMTYVLVDDVASLVARVEDLGGKVELEETNALGKVALVRDPSGAGFTCYEGSAKGALHSRPKPGQWCWSELFVSDLSKVETFYAELLGWSFEVDDESDDRYIIRGSEGQRVGAVQVASNEVKGDKEFWGVSFSVQDAQATQGEIREAGGTLVYEHVNSDGVHYLAHDSQGAAFFITECAESGDRSNSSQASGRRAATTSGNLKWRSLVGLVVVYLAVLFEANWLWGVLFLFWVIPDLKSGTTYFIEPLSRRENPVLYWAIVLTWLILSVFLLLPST